MYIDKKWLKVTALALSLPSSIIVTLMAITGLIEKKIISNKVGYTIFFVIIISIIISIVRHAFYKKN